MIAGPVVIVLAAFGYLEAAVIVAGAWIMCWDLFGEES